LISLQYKGNSAYSLHRFSRGLSQLIFRRAEAQCTPLRIHMFVNQEVTNGAIPADGIMLLSKQHLEYRTDIEAGVGINN
jgi:hypothetical protein